MERTKSGISLNEISFVLLMVSLLIGASLKSQELIANAKHLKDKKAVQKDSQMT